MIKPKGFDPEKKYPLLMYVYGEPAGAVAGGDRLQLVGCAPTPGQKS